MEQQKEAVTMSRYYRLMLDDFSAASFTSFDKVYYGTLEQINAFFEEMKSDEEIAKRQKYERILFRGITMRKSAPINIIVHYPKTEEGMRELRRRVASVRADIVMDQIRKLDWPTSERIRLVDAIIADAKAEMKKK